MNNHEPETENAEPEDRPIPEAERLLYRDLWEYLDTNGFEAWETRSILGFTLKDGTHRFSVVDPLTVLLKVIEESYRSDRLLVIVSVAYLEDQLRLLLAKFFVDSAVSRDLLDPTNSAVASLMPMANLALALGLVTKDWHDTVKKMARLRNKFAHIPTARSFVDLIAVDAKASKLMDSIVHQHQQFFSETVESEIDFKKTYGDAFLRLYALLQFAIDHVAGPHKRQPLAYGTVVGITTINGVSKEKIRHYFDYDGNS